MDPIRRRRRRGEKRKASIDQVLNILDYYILCGEEAEDEPERPSETSQLLISLAIRELLILELQLQLQTLLSSSPTSDSCSDSFGWENWKGSMGQVLSNIHNYILCGEMPSKIWQLLISPANRELLLLVLLLRLQTLLSSSPTSDSCSDSSDTEQNSPQNQSEEEEEEEEEEVSKAVVTKEKWMQHYSSCQKILLVVEGDFSFSASLVVAFGSATNTIVTSLNSEGFLSKNYRSAMSNIQSLRSRGAMVMHGVDATEMANLLLFAGKTFDRIVYNSPHARFVNKESKESQLRDSSESYVLNPPEEEEQESEESDEEEEVSKAVVIEEKWMQHYSSCQKILLVGEGDFSFSASLVVAFGSATNTIVTSLNSEGDIKN